MSGLRHAGIILALTALWACLQPAFAGEKSVAAPAAAVRSDEAGTRAAAIFAGGCFWGVEGVLSHVPGVSSVVSGYHGGSAESATYARVSDGDTGHAEAVYVVYDPKVVRYDELLRILFSVVTDPTSLDSQGPDHGSQYRSALVPLSADQRKVAAAYLAQLDKSGVWGASIVTRIETFRRFYPAEKYHQDFMAANPRHPYILRWDAPKVAALERLYPDHYRRGFTRH